MLFHLVLNWSGLENHVHFNRLLKLIFTNREEAKSLLHQYNALKRVGIRSIDGLHLIRDKS